MEYTVSEARQQANVLEIVASAKILPFRETLPFTRLSARLRKMANDEVGAEEEALTKKVEPIRDEIKVFLEKEDFKGESLNSELQKRLMEHSEVQSINEELSLLSGRKLVISEKIEISADTVIDGVAPVEVSLAGQKITVDPYALLRTLFNQEVVTFT